MHFTILVCTKFSEKNENAKIAQLNVSLNLVTLRYIGLKMHTMQK